MSNLIRVTACAKILTQRAHGFRAKARLQRVSRARATERATGRATEREEWGVCMGGGGMTKRAGRRGGGPVAVRSLGAGLDGPDPAGSPTASHTPSAVGYRVA